MRTLRSAQPGFSLLEMLIAMVVGMLAVIVVFQVFAVSEGYARTTSSGTDAAQNGRFAMSELQRQLKEAGFGFNVPDAIGCSLDAGNSTLVPTPMVLAPASISAADAQGNRSITFMRGSPRRTVGANLVVTAPAAGTVKLKNRFDFTLGDRVLLMPGSSCWLGSVSALPSATGSEDDVQLSGMPAIVFAKDTKVLNLGAELVWRRLALDGDALVSVNQLNPADRMVIVNSIVGLQAQYGKDDGTPNGTVTRASYFANDGVVDRFDADMPATPAQWSQVLSVRVAVAARSRLKEKFSAAGVCETTTAAPKWEGGTFDLSHITDWGCYRYQVYETTIPLRNILWAQK